MSFQVGDQVRVKNFKVRPSGWNARGEMDKWMGKIVTIKDITNNSYNNSIRIEEDNGLWFFRESDFKNINDMNKFNSEDFEI